MESVEKGEKVERRKLWMRRESHDPCLICVGRSGEIRLRRGRVQYSIPGEGAIETGIAQSYWLNGGLESIHRVCNKCWLKVELQNWL